MRSERYAAGWLLALAACGAEAPEGPVTIQNERTWAPVGHDFSPGRTSAARFGYSRRSEPAATAHAGTLKWETPEGWTEVAPASMRQANFLVSGDERAECYLTILSGDGGGVLANVNRWRSQMSLEPTDEETLAGSLRAPFMGTQGLVVDFAGTWSGMSGDQDGQGYRLIGVLAVEQGQAHFLKMIGPDELVAGQKRAFLALAASFHEDHSEHNHGSDAGAQDPGADPHAGLDMGSAMGGQISTGPSAGALSWTAPAGWRQAPARAMRDVTFFLGPDDRTECYVAQLGGTAGGSFANINRWRSQMGQAALTTAEFEQLPTVDMLGGIGTLVEVAGSFTGMGGEQIEEAALLGVVCPLPGRAVFVKLIGPAEVVTSAREDFVAFCESIQEGN